LIVLLGASALLAGCISTATLYPANEEAKSAGLITARYESFGIGAGKISLLFPDGEKLSVEYSTVDTNSYGFGSVYGSIYGGFGQTFGTGAASSMAMAGSSPGVATLYGDRGTTMTCEYIVNKLTGKGAGACKASTNAIFKLHF
jgi:hypothetical protein